MGNSLISVMMACSNVCFDSDADLDVGDDWGECLNGTLELVEVSGVNADIFEVTDVFSEAATIVDICFDAVVYAKADEDEIASFPVILDEGVAFSLAEISGEKMTLSLGIDDLSVIAASGAVTFELEEDVCMKNFKDKSTGFASDKFNGVRSVVVSDADVVADLDAYINVGFLASTSSDVALEAGVTDVGSIIDSSADVVSATAIDACLDSNSDVTDGLSSLILSGACAPDVSDSDVNDLISGVCFASDAKGYEDLGSVVVISTSVLSELDINV